MSFSETPFLAWAGMAGTRLGSVLSVVIFEYYVGCQARASRLCEVGGGAWSEASRKAWKLDLDACKKSLSLNGQVNFVYSRNTPVKLIASNERL